VPRIIVQVYEGRTVDQKRELVRGITDAVVEAFAVQPSQVSIVIEEMSPQNYGAGGILRIDSLARSTSGNGDSNDSASR
jgi:4-oxalocrotonate tautomerase